jgi:RNA polymerase sigma-70 factor, ECF subfamily
MYGVLGPDASDDELLQRARTGDRDAFAALYDRYQHIVYRFARAMIGSADAARDVSQEVFVAFMRDLPRYDPTRSALATYLYGVTRNVSRHRIRRERRFLSLDVLGSRAQEPALGPRDHADRLSAAQSLDALRRALGSLPLRYREVIVLCDLHELPGNIVAQIVGASATAVRSRLHRGRRMLKERMERLGRAAARPNAHTARFSI